MATQKLFVVSTWDTRAYVLLRSKICSMTWSISFLQIPPFIRVLKQGARWNLCYQVCILLHIARQWRHLTLLAPIISPQYASKPRLYSRILFRGYRILAVAFWFRVPLSWETYLCSLTLAPCLLHVQLNMVYSIRPFTLDGVARRFTLYSSLHIWATQQESFQSRHVCFR